MGKKKKKNRREPETLELPLVGVETHAHLDLEDFDEDRDEIIARAADCGVQTMGNVFLGPDAYENNRHYFDKHPNIFFILGIHPNHATDCTQKQIERMKEMFAADNRLKAVGEIGLDYYWDKVPAAVQKEAFAAQLHMARELDVPVVIHSRDAHDDSVALLEAEGFKGYPVLWHCFGGNTEQAAQLLDNGWHISIPGPVTFNSNHDVQAAVPSIPLDRIMVETDCPFLTPEPWRGKRNHPSLVGFTAEKVALLKAISLTDLWKITGDNARRFFHLS